MTEHVGHMGIFELLPGHFYRFPTFNVGSQAHSPHGAPKLLHQKCSLLPSAELSECQVCAEGTPCSHLCCKQLEGRDLTLSIFIFLLPCHSPMPHTKFRLRKCLQKEYMQLNCIKPNSPVKTRAKNLNRQFSILCIENRYKGSPRMLEWGAYPFCSISSQARNQTRVSRIAGGFFTN